MKVGLDDFLVHQGLNSFQQLLDSTPYDESLMELQQASLKLLNFSEKYDFKYNQEENKSTFIKSVYKLIKDGHGETSVISIYLNDNLKIKENLNLAVGTKKDNFIKRCNLDESNAKELRQFLDIVFEFTSLQTEVRKIESGIKNELKKKFPANSSISQKKRDKALKLAKSPDLLHRVKNILQQIGLVGESDKGLLLYISLTSRMLNRPISIILKAGSSAGKSYLVKTVLKLIPEEAYIEMTGLSPKALVYLNETFSHRFLIIYEFHGVKEDDYTEYMIRTLLSENKIIYAVVEKNEHEGHETRIIEKEGPTGLITTTTHPNIHDENETRLFSISVNEDNAQTKSIKEKIAQDYQELQTEFDEGEFEDLLNLQKILKPLRVKIPFAKELSDRTPDEPLRMRRDFQRILAVVEAIALLHQHQRNIEEKDGIKYIEASLEDYYMARCLLEEPLNLTLYNKYPQTLELVNKINCVKVF